MNLAWLHPCHEIEVVRADVWDAEATDAAVNDARPEVVLHLASPVAVTTSVADPRSDFATNALGTFNVLDSLPRLAPDALVLYASTFKVYGRMEEVSVEGRRGRYEIRDLPDGVLESQPLDFHSQCGCSKGAVDQYVLDFHETYGMRTVTFRQSCIDGPRQFGVEDHGWVAWSLIAPRIGRPLTIYGESEVTRKSGRAMANV